jgi:hypothetical protein
MSAYFVSSTLLLYPIINNQSANLTLNQIFVNIFFNNSWKKQKPYKNFFSWVKIRHPSYLSPEKNFVLHHL